MSFMNLLQKYLLRTLKIQCRYYTKLDDRIASTFEKILGKDNISLKTGVRSQHAIDESHHKAVIPELVVFPKNVEMISSTMKICQEHCIPITPFGAGTGMEGGCIPLYGGVCLDMSLMNSVIAVNAEDFDATVEAGCPRLDLNHALKQFALYFPVDPGANATIGGMAATSASGTNAVRYGTMRENVINLEVVLADGTIVHTAGKDRRTRKTAAGYNLTNLFVGSEGTLGIISSVSLKIYGISEAVAAASCQFGSAKEAIDATVLVLQSGISVARIEFLDEVAMRQCINYSQLKNLEAKPTLFVEFHGTQAGVEEQANLTGSILTSQGGSDFLWATKQEDRNKLWAARHSALYAATSSAPNKKSYTTDVAVPISELSDIINQTKQDIDKSQFVGSIVGHVGDGNFHVLLLVDPNNEEEMHRCKQLSDQIAMRALSVGGTCTGEHGIGLGKRSLLKKEFSEETLFLMKQIKHTLDPKNLLNPGKIL